MKKILKKIAVGALASAMTAGLLTGCGNSSGYNINYTVEEASTTKVLVIGDYDIYMDEILVYTLQALTIDGYSSDEFDNSLEEEEKERILSLLRENKIIYDVAIHNDAELDEDDIETVQQSVDNFFVKYDEDFVNAYGLTEDIVFEVFSEQALVSKFENDMKNQMGQDINDDLDEAYADYSFHSIYYLVFPTVEVDENDEPATDDDGNYISLSDEEKEEVYAQAEEALEKLRNGADYEEIAEEYGISEYSTSRSGYVGGYEDDDYNDALAELENGECTDIIETSVGYTISYMISADDEDLKSLYVYSLASDYLDSEFETLETTWLSSILVDTENDLEGTVWADFVLKDVALDLETAGILSTDSE